MKEGPQLTELNNPHPNFLVHYKKLKENPNFSKEIIENLKKENEQELISVVDSRVQPSVVELKDEEPLVDLKDHLNERLQLLPDKLAKEFDLRQTDVASLIHTTVLYALNKLLKKLPSDIGLYFFEGYRTLEEQNLRYNKYLAKNLANYPEKNKEEVEKKTSEFICPVKEGITPPHSTGGAIEVLPFYVKTGELFPLGIIKDNKWNLPIFAKNLTAEEIENRKMFMEKCIESGFALYAGEILQLSVGDGQWHHYTGQPPLYRGLTEEEAKQKTIKLR
jgi:D-alanyl-D-alanine dipeptidase